MEDRLILLHCSLIDGFGPASLTKIIHFLKNSGSSTLESIYSLKENDFERAGLSKDVSKKLMMGLLNPSLLETELELIQKFNIQYLTILDSGANSYPELLKNIHLPPLVLYVKGENLHSFEKTVAIVGSRNCDNYGARAIDLVLPDIIKCGWTSVSGGAYGIDTLVHQKTLNLGGKTVAVLGSGLLNIYPASNKKLFRTITENSGSIVSSFPLNSPPLPGNFPARNRIIAGLSKACIVIQAAQKSGALITASFALEQGKDVGAIPGAIDNVLSVGCNDLIRQGAACVTNSVQVLELLQDDSYANNLCIQFKTTNAPVSDSVKEAKAQTIDDKILSHCKNAMSFDELLLMLGLSFSELNNKLLELQLKGLITQNFHGLWKS